jgi:hypothetical protein
VKAAATTDGSTHRNGGCCDSKWWHLTRWRRLRQSDGGAPLRWSQPASLLGRCGSGTAVRKDRGNAAEELGNEDSGVALHLGVIDPLWRCGANLQGRGRATWAGASDACGAFCLCPPLLSVWMVRCVLSRGKEKFIH